MIIEQASVKDAAEILALQKLAYRSEAELYDNYTIPPLTQTLEEMRADINTMNELEKSVSQATRFELFTGSRSERNIAFYRKLGYSLFKREELTDRVTLVFLEKRV